MSSKYRPATQAVRSGSRRSAFNEHSEAIFLSSSFCFETAAQAAARFSGEEEGFVYSRFTNPSVAMFQERLAALEGAECCLATASGMSAIMSLVMSLCSAGDHVLVSQSVFGATVQMFGSILNRFGVEASFVPLSEVDAWRRAVKPNTKLLFVETPSNPLTEVGDIAALARVAKDAGALLAVDNCFCTPALQKPLDLGADLIIHSATKYLDGQGRCLGGAILGPEKLLMDKVFPFLRTAGPALSAFNAWVFLKGMETLDLRMRAQSAAALELARWLESHPAVERVYYPFLESHPQHAMARAQQSAGGPVVSFVVKGGREAAWKLVDATELVSITANLGDTRSTLTHPASTTHGRIKPEQRAAAGIVEGMLRVAVGLEDVEDLKEDLGRGMG